MESLIPVINKLQDVFNAVDCDGIGLPQIVVLGTQSSGKSSVLENIVGRSFLPRGTGIVTRTPLVLQLVHTPNEPGPHPSQEDGTLKAEEYGIFLHSTKIFTDFDDIRSEIEMQTDRIAGTNKGISDEGISLKIFSPTVVNLTLVDLPGLIKVPVGDQPKDIENQIRNLVLKYVRDPNSIIMAVVTANTDMATHESLKLAKDCDPNGDRTLAVVTKLDLMDAGTDAEKILTGQVIPVKLGIIGVINRSQQDIVDGKPISEALTKESAFLKKNYPSLADRNGTPYLSKMLNKLLMNHIKDSLPDLKKRVQLKITEQQTLLKSYGNDVEDKNRTLLDIITRFSLAYSATITGTTTVVESNDLVGGARIGNIFHEIFKKMLNGVKPLAGMSQEQIITCMRNATGPRPALFIPEMAFDILCRKQIELFKEPALTCAELVHDEMSRMIEHCCSLMKHELERFPILHDKMVNMISDMLRERTEAAKSMIENLIAIELAYINPRQNGFDKQRVFLCPRTAPVGSFTFGNVALSDDEKDDCKRMQNLIESYFTAVRFGIQDNVPKSIMHFLVNFMKDNLLSRLVCTLFKPGDPEGLLQENENVAVKRKANYDMLERLHKANSIINEIREVSLP